MTRSKPKGKRTAPPKLTKEERIMILEAKIMALAAIVGDHYRELKVLEDRVFG